MSVSSEQVPRASRGGLGELALGCGIGVFSGLFGVGGGVLLVPILVSLLGLARKRAHATSLVAVAVIAGAGAGSYALNGRVAWLSAILVALGGLVGSQIGAFFLHRIADRWLAVIFGGFLLIVAVSMVIAPRSGHASANDIDVTTAHLAILLATGLAAGALSALLGVGGGVIMVPILVLAAGLGQHLAEGTALAAMCPIALVGAAKLSQAPITAPQWPRGLRLGLGGVLGAPLGAIAALQLPATTLQRAFAVVAAATAIHLLWTHLRPDTTPRQAQPQKHN